MRSTPHGPPPHPRTSSVRQDAITYPYAYAAPGRQAPSAGYEHDDNTTAEAGPTRRCVPGRGNRAMPASNTGPYPSDVNRTLSYPEPAPARTAAPAVAIMQPSSPFEQDHTPVVYTVQNTTTDTHRHETEYGGVLTIRTTTVTRTITERLVASDEDDDSSENGEVYLDDARNEASVPSLHR
ncbi:hypothetical protein LMJF_04_0880 [Leishmania major strain Friedlin]|uniref:Uncharacterized protein n=1 Tax=Leishmania major TaxID=5664 RepID=O97006_LEIMA|nr:hypothetical protein LMJF_04_0880 [Leishmania major strain Friedlin]CAC22632.1 hypothetical protein LMJF_04_0880 [Leishmania major strain Friedlin]CAG9567789.1 hypothetical_protein_-_conserved [Leishmania major strain Friedlin]|eukprot:XP_888599.1 hypothetical protein LMJF_04_0880 [Leishmania major strain Friedlin]